MTLFLRMSQSSGGSDHLLESNIIEALCDCRFLTMLPESDFSSGILSRYNNLDHFEGSSLQIYYRLLLPALRLVAAISCQVGKSNVSLSNRV
jgi:hypothetical protein